jgi:hypothetical protein
VTGVVDVEVGPARLEGSCETCENRSCTCQADIAPSSGYTYASCAQRMPIPDRSHVQGMLSAAVTGLACPRLRRRDVAIGGCDCLG